MTEIELRPFVEDVEVRSVGDGKLVLSGTAIRYGARSRDLGGFRERIMAGAATEPLQKGEVEAREEHLPNRYLGRTGNGTLRLFDSKEALRYEVDLPDTAVGREVAALAERGDYKGSSFGFRANPKAVTWTKGEDGLPLRTITAFNIVRDVGPTVRPAYEATTAEAALRCLPAEAELDIEVRSVLDAARAGTLADLLDNVPVIGEETPPVAIHRRPSSWFV